MQKLWLYNGGYVCGHDSGEGIRWAYPSWRISPTHKSGHNITSPTAKYDISQRRVAVLWALKRKRRNRRIRKWWTAATETVKSDCRTILVYPTQFDFLIGGGAG